MGAILCGHDGRRGCLYHVCVQEAYRKHGIGQKLCVVPAVDALAAEHINKINLIAFKKNEVGNAFLAGTRVDLPRGCQLLRIRHK